MRTIIQTEVSPTLGDIFRIKWTSAPSIGKKIQLINFPYVMHQMMQSIAKPQPEIIFKNLIYYYVSFW